MITSELTPHDRLDALRGRLRARAAGWWRVSGEGLEQVAFAAVADMPGEVAQGFAAATRSVPLKQGDLGIVLAVQTGAAAVSRASELAADSGSGLWLRRFGATRSVAVPIRDESGAITRVVSVALCEETPDDAAVAQAILAEAAGWADEQVRG